MQHVDPAALLVNDFGGRSYAIITKGLDPPSLHEVLAPGSLTIVVPVEAGELDAFRTCPMVRGYLEDGRVVLEVFESRLDAERFATITQTAGHV